MLLPRADIATDTLLAGLQEIGWQVDDVTAYRTVRAAPPPAETREALKGGGFDAVLFTSSSTVRNLVGIAGKPHDTTVLACIGPQTVGDGHASSACASTCSRRRPTSPPSSRRSPRSRSSAARPPCRPSRRCRAPRTAARSPGCAAKGTGA